MQPKRPNIILVLFDSMRARNLSCYGYNRSTTPNLDRLATEGALFKQAFVQAPFTVASTASILTSVHPSVHHLEYYGQRLADRLVTLPEVLQTAGYDTAGFVANPHLNPSSGLTRGFNHFNDGRPWYKKLPGVKRMAAWAESGRALNRCINERLQQVGDHPFFFFIFYNDSHVPFSDLPRILLPLARKKYHTPDFEKIAYTDQELAKIIRLYDRSLRRADRRLGELLELIERSPYGENTVWILSADHGEGLDRRHERAGHGRLYENGIHVPLIVWSPGMVQSGKVVEDMVAALDLAPTICEWAQAQTPAYWQGKSIAGNLNGAPSKFVRQHIISEYHDSRCVRSTRWKSIHRGAGIGVRRVPEPGEVELYDLENDPQEQVNLAARMPVVVAEHSRVLRQFVESLDQHQYAPSTFEMDEQVIEQLRGLGYLN